MYLIVGLGNPGSKYQQTRHNIGFQVLDELADAYNLSFRESKWQAEVVKAVIAGHQALLAKPETFMNESGRAVGAIASYYRIEPERIIVVHDDLDLELGRVKVVVNRGAGGHNGIISIIKHLGSKKFIRIRVGVGRPQTAIPISKYVLSKFNPEERGAVADKVRDIVGDVELIVDKGLTLAMNLINSR